MTLRDCKGPALTALAIVTLACGWTAPGWAQGVPKTYGDSASLSSGAPITAPTTVDAGQTINVVVENARSDSAIELWGPVDEAGRGTRLVSAPLTGGTAPLTAPDASGSYELRYVDGSGRQLGRTAFDVAAVPLALEVLTPVAPGGEMRVTWQGPARPGDRFEIIDERGATVGGVPVAGDRMGRNVSDVTVPSQRGRYALRYVTGQGAVLRSVGFDVR